MGASLAPEGTCEVVGDCLETPQGVQVLACPKRLDENLRVASLNYTNHADFTDQPKIASLERCCRGPKPQRRGHSKERDSPSQLVGFHLTSLQ